MQVLNSQQKILVDVLMSVCDNNIEYIKKTISSILNQTYKNFLFIIVDDNKRQGDKEKLKEIIEIFNDQRILYLNKQKNIGLTKSLNWGLKYCKNKYLARIDVGDIAHPQRLEKQKNFLEQNNDYCLVGTFTEIIDRDGKIIKKIYRPTDYQIIKRRLPRGNIFNHSSLMIKNDTLRATNGYNEDFYFAQDYELILRIASQHKITLINEFLTQYRFDEKGTSFSQKAKRQERCALKARWLAITKYGYGFGNIIFFVPGIVSYLIPTKIKILVFKKILWRKK